MNYFIRIVFVSATLVALASAYGFKYNKNPYSGECKLQLNLPGLGQKEAFPGIMNTRYGSNNQHGSSSSGSGSNHGHHASASGHYGSGAASSTKYASASNQQGNRYNPSTGAGRYPSASGASYGGSSSNNYGSASSSNYGASGSQSQNNYENENYGGISGNYGSSGSASYAPSAPPTGNYGSSGSASYAPSAPPTGNRGTGNDRDTGNYASSINRETGNYASSSNRDRDRYPEAATGSYGSSDYDRDYGSSANRESNKQASSASSSKYGAASSGNRGSSASDAYRPSVDRDYDRYTPTSGTGNRGSSSSSSYGGGSSAENYGESETDRNPSDYGSSANRESNQYASSAGSSNYGAASSGNRGSSASDAYRPSVDRDYDRYTPTSGTGNNRGSSSSGSSYGGGGSSSENYGLGGNLQQEDDYWDRVFANEVLSSHNSYRARHTTPPVTLDVKMSQQAQEWAAQLAAGAVYGHSPEAIEGELGEALQLTSDSATGADVVGKWYKEKYNYDFRNPILVKTPVNKSNYHFTAVVWKGTRKIGVGKATANDGRTFVVVNYWPPPNIFDVLEDNVLPSRKDLPPTSEQFY